MFCFYFVLVRFSWGYCFFSFQQNSSCLFNAHLEGEFWIWNNIRVRQSKQIKSFPLSSFYESHSYRKGNPVWPRANILRNITYFSLLVFPPPNYSGIPGQRYGKPPLSSWLFDLLHVFLLIKLRNTRFSQQGSLLGIHIQSLGGVHGRVLLFYEIPPSSILAIDHAVGNRFGPQKRPLQGLADTCRGPVGSFQGPFRVRLWFAVRRKDREIAPLDGLIAH